MSMERGRSFSSSCIICKSQAVTGISILGMCICSHCEKALLASKATSPGYDNYVRSLRAIWQGVFPLELEGEESANSFREPLEAVICRESEMG